VHEQLAARPVTDISHDSAHSDQRSLWSDHGKKAPSESERAALSAAPDP
jgi:hypothetical protein